MKQATISQCISHILRLKAKIEGKPRCLNRVKPDLASIELVAGTSGGTVFMQNVVEKGTTVTIGFP